MKATSLVESTEPRSACVTCKLRTLCLPAGLEVAEFDRLDGVGATQQAVRRGEALCHAGERFAAVFAVKAGTFKTSLPLPAGGQQVTGFPMAGDLIGLTGVAEGVLAFDAIALEDALVCVIDFERLEALARANPVLQRRIHRYMSQELVASRTLLGQLAQARADERVATFLLQLAERQRLLGLSPDDVVLRMSREDIGNLLGLRIETVSRCLSRLEGDWAVDVRGRRIHIRDQARLRLLARGLAALEPA
ncbi:MAG TPA: helix-turn-helix domain-containing protein [Rhizobacter sp.]|nr:helix-turn-helix domain-containing protein [Rhizobacter sp.]